MNDFMKGRNGADELTIVMGFAGIVIAMIGSMARVQWLSWIAIAVSRTCTDAPAINAASATATPILKNRLFLFIAFLSRACDRPHRGWSPSPHRQPFPGWGLAADQNEIARVCRSP